MSEYIKKSEVLSEIIDANMHDCFANYNSYSKFYDKIKAMPGDNIKDEDFDEEQQTKFYYCESEDDYYIGQRQGTLYYAKYDKKLKQWVWSMSKHLPWGEHIKDDSTLWKEYTYSSEPKEMYFIEWLFGFIKKYADYLPIKELRDK